jgi:hypothetical protein
MKALIVSGRVVELHEIGFPVHESWSWVDAPEGVTAGYTYVGGEFVAPVVSMEEVAAKYEVILDNHLDSVAKSNGFKNGRYALATRAGYPNAWQQLGIAFGSWMDNCNVLGYQTMDAVLKGTIPLPTPEEFIVSLPEFVAP